MRLLVLTDRRLSAAAGRDLVETVTAAVAAGAPTILFREKDLAADERRTLGEQVAEACASAELIVASDVDLARHLGASTVHLAGNDPWPDTDLALGLSCHTETDLARVTQDGASYATLSPVFPTASKPGYGPTLGLCTLAEAIDGTSIPVVALGGIDPSTVGGCLAAGAAGVAVMGGVMSAPDPEAAVRGLLDAGARP